MTPFGLKTSTAALVRGLDLILSGMNEFVIPYIDDILIASESEQTHLTHLEIILERFKQHNVTLNLRKCEFKLIEVNFLGHILSRKGIKRDPHTIQAIKDFSPPKNQKQLQVFLGTVNFSDKFTEKFARELVSSLGLLQKGNRWRREPEDQDAFERMKRFFIQWIMLHCPDHLNELR